MHKFKSLSVFIVMLSVMSCSNNIKEHVIQTFDNGKPKLIEYYQINKKDSTKIKEVQYYLGGHKKVEGTYVNNKKDGAWKFWFEHGLVWSEGFFTKGIRTGRTLVYHENGKLFYEGIYLDGKKDGLWIFYNSEGEKVNEITFDSGNIISQEPVNKSTKE